jgi:uncharacterized tellurite resistance protein B-like protein
MKTLTREDRLLLLKFVCAFAWADLEIHQKERHFVRRLMKKLQLDAGEQHLVEGWLDVPPKPEEVDPNKVPSQHRKLFLDTARELISADGTIDEAEAENFSLLEDLLTGR